MLAPLAKYARERQAINRAIQSIRLVGGETYSDWRSIHYRDYMEQMNGRYKREGTRYVFDEDRFPDNGEDLTIIQTFYQSLGGVPPEDVVCVKLVGDKFNDELLSVIVGNLRSCPRLKVLLLSGTKVTDNGLKSIGQLRGLRVIGLHKNCNTEHGELILQESLPECDIVCGSRP